MKPLIGITSNYWSAEDADVSIKQSAPGGDWSYIGGDYVRAVEAAGGIPVIIPIQTDLNLVNGLLDRLDGILFEGGKDISPEFYGEQPNYPLGRIDPIRDILELRLAKEIMENRYIPVLGICRGAQLINAAAGGTLYQDINSQNSNAFKHSLTEYPMHYPTHDVKIMKDTKLHTIYGETLRVNSFHHQAVKDIAPGFKVSAVSNDGIIEAIEFGGGKFIFAVQWHPEMMFQAYPEQLKIFKTFIDECLKDSD